MSEKSPEFGKGDKKIITPNNLTAKNAREYLLQNIGNTKLPEEKFNKLVRDLENVLKQKSLDKKKIQEESRKSLEAIKIEADLQRLENLLKDCESNFNDLNSALNSAGITDKVFDFFTGSQVSKTLNEAYTNTRNVFTTSYNKYLLKLKSDKIRLSPSQKAQLEKMMNKGSIVAQMKLDAPSFTDMAKNQYKNTKKQTKKAAEVIGNKIEDIKKGIDNDKKTVVIEHGNGDIAKEIKYANGDYEIVFHDGTRQITYNSGEGNIAAMIIYADGRKSIKYRQGVNIGIQLNQSGILNYDSAGRPEENKKKEQSSAQSDKEENKKKEQSSAQSDKSMISQSDANYVKELAKSSYVSVPQNFSNFAERTQFYNLVFSAVDINSHMIVQLPGGMTFTLEKSKGAESYSIAYGGNKGIKHEGLSRKEVKNSLSFADYTNKMGLGFLIPHSREVIDCINKNSNGEKIFDRDGLDREEKNIFLSKIGSLLLPGYKNTIDLESNEAQFRNINIQGESINKKNAKLKDRVGGFSSIESLAKALYPANGGKDFDSRAFLNSLGGHKESV